MKIVSVNLKELRGSGLTNPELKFLVGARENSSATGGELACSSGSWGKCFSTENEGTAERKCKYTGIGSHFCSQYA